MNENPCTPVGTMERFASTVATYCTVQLVVVWLSEQQATQLLHGACGSPLVWHGAVLTVGYCSGWKASSGLILRRSCYW